MSVRVADYVARAAQTPLARYAHEAPWGWTANAEALVQELIDICDADYEVDGAVAIHHSAIVEPGAALKGAVFIGANCFVSSTALLRGGCWLDEGCIVGPSCELKTSFMFRGAKLAHLNFVGDSVLGAEVNIEAGAMIANYRNERTDKRIRIKLDAAPIDTGVDKFGVLAGDGVKIGANAVIAPGALLAANTIVPRLGLIDQS